MKYYVDQPGEDAELAEVNEGLFCQLVANLNACGKASDWEVCYMGFNCAPEEQYLMLRLR